MRKYFIFSLLFLFSIPFFVFPQETLTITTYYPSPVGVYGELRSQRTAIGDTYFDAVAHPWDTGGLLDPEEISQNADLVVEGDVGIGTIGLGQYAGKLAVVGTSVFTGSGGTGATQNIFSSESAAINVGGTLVLGGNTANTVNPYAFAGFKGAKQTAAGDGDYKGYLAVYTPDNWGTFSERMRIDGTGNVGIGVTAPATRLEVQGGEIKATGGLIIETRDATQGDPAAPAVGQIWLRTDINP